MTDPKVVVAHLVLSTDVGATVCPMCVEGNHAFGHNFATQVDSEQHDKGDCKALRLDDGGNEVRCSCTWRPVLN